MTKLKKKKRIKKDNIRELIGVAKILDILWDNSYYSMGKSGAERIQKEMVYYFGKNWARDMYKLIEKNPEPLKRLKDLMTTPHKSKEVR